MVSGNLSMQNRLNNVFAPEQIYCRTSNGNFGREGVVSTFANKRDHYVLCQWDVQCKSSISSPRMITRSGAGTSVDMTAFGLRNNIAQKSYPIAMT
jgi:hypothetical protein